ncbi:MAG: ABC transporter substrate-binding protein [Solirubrobacterales bacterium]|nr:ABC transporter substrate-binding protein [Solirubrobacterales bacterium]
MTALELTMAISHYDHVEPVLSGEVPIAGTSPVFFELPIPEMFRRFINFQEWELSEMSSAQYVSRRAAGDDRVIALPVFTSRMFRHSCIIVRRDRIRGPEDLRGARIGTPEWTLSACVWARGMLSDMYGITPADMTWFQGGLERPGRGEAVKPPALGDEVSLTAVSDSTLEQMIYAGEIDAIMAPQYPPGLRQAQQSTEGLVGRLFDDPLSAEAAYLEQTGVFPVMHLMGMRRSFYEEHPWVASNVYRAFEAAKQRYYARLIDPQASRVPLPLLGEYLAELRERFGSDPWPYGLEPNRHVFETLIRYEREQGLIANDISVDALFAPVEAFVDVT